MPIRINCPACKTANSVAEDKRGKKVRCRECDKLLNVPEADGKKKRSEEDAIQDGRKVKAATSRKRDADDENDEDDDRPKKKKKEPAKGGPGMMLAVGGVAAVLLLCVVGVGGIGAIFLFRAKPDGDPKAVAQVIAVVDRKDVADPVGLKKDPIGNKDVAGKKDNPVEAKKDPIVDPDAGKPLPAQLPPELVAKVKQATVYLHVTMPSGVTAEGSGFFAMDRGIIVTNAHVLGMLLESSKAPKQVDVVLDSGLPSEIRMVGEVLGVDRVSDLAVIRVPDNGKLPAPLILATDAPTELQMVYIFGFPFGEKLGKNITITEKKITSLRPDKEGGLKEIQIDGGMNPGNSGGPVVNTRGSLVGVSVSIISGAQISFAVPAEKVRRVMEGRVADHQHGEAYRQQGETRLPVRLTCLDPLNQIRDMRVEVWTGPAGAMRPRTNDKPQPAPGDGPRQAHVVKYANGVGMLDVPLPPLPGGHVYWVQPVLSSVKGTHWGVAQSTAADFAVLERKPVNLTIDLEKQKERTTKIDSRITVTETLGKKETGRQVIQAMAETLEVLQEPVLKDTRKTATIRTAYGPVNVGLNINGKAIKFGRDELDAMAIVRGMPPTFVIDDTNATVSFVTVSLTPTSPKYYLKDLVQTLNNLVHNPFEATQFKMPNRVVQPQETFPSQSTMAMRVGGGQQGPQPKTKVPPKGPPPPNIVDLKMNLTYQGVRIRNGREEAILTVVGTLESRKIKGRSLGDISGKIGFDVAAGFISSAKLKIFAESEETIPGIGTFRDSQSQDIELDRAAGNLKNLALAAPRPGPGPGTVVKGKSVFVLNGTLALSDQVDPKPGPVAGKEPRMKVLPVLLQAGKEYAISLDSTAFDPYLRLEDPTGKTVAEDDDSGGGLNALIRYRPTQTGQFKVICTTFDGKLGPFQFKVTELDGGVVAKDPGPGTGKNPGPGTGGPTKAIGGATRIIGGGPDPQFTDEAPAGGLLVGFEFGLGTFAKHDTIKAVRPIYRVKAEEIKGKQYGTKLERVVTVKAKADYAVGSINVKGGLWIDGITVTFMRVVDGKLNPADTYQSEVFGNPAGNRIPLGGDGSPVVGIVGKSNANDCTGIGLLFKAGALKPPAKGAQPPSSQ